MNTVEVARDKFRTTTRRPYWTPSPLPDPVVVIGVCHERSRRRLSAARGFHRIDQAPSRYAATTLPSRDILSWTGRVAILSWCDMRRLGDWSGPSVRRITPTSHVNHSDTFKNSCKKNADSVLIIRCDRMHAKVIL